MILVLCLAKLPPANQRGAPLGDPENLEIEPEILNRLKRMSLPIIMRTKRANGTCSGKRQAKHTYKPETEKKKQDERMAKLHAQELTWEDVVAKNTSMYDIAQILGQG